MVQPSIYGRAYAGGRRRRASDRGTSELAAAHKQKCLAAQETRASQQHTGLCLHRTREQRNGFCVFFSARTLAAWHAVDSAVRNGSSAVTLSERKIELKITAKFRSKKQRRRAQTLVLADSTIGIRVRLKWKRARERHTESVRERERQTGREGMGRKRSFPLFCGGAGVVSDKLFVCLFLRLLRENHVR